MICDKDGPPLRAIFALSGTFCGETAAKTRRSSCNPANSRSDYPLNSKNMDIPFRFASLRGIIAAKEAAIGSLLFHPAKPEDRAAEVP